MFISATAAAADVEPDHPFDEETAKKSACVILSPKDDKDLGKFVREDLKILKAESKNTWEVRVPARFSMTHSDTPLTITNNEVYLHDLTSQEKLRLEHFVLSVDAQTNHLVIKHLVPLNMLGKWSCINTSVVLSPYKE